MSKRSKKVPGVKGVVWAGDELQVIVGGESGGIKNEIKKINSEYYEKIQDSFNTAITKKKFSILYALSGILVPCLPILTASGLLLSLQSILVQFKALPSDTNANLWGSLLFTSAIAGLSLVGIFFCYNTVKFFGENPLYGVLVGLILTSRLYQINGIEIPVGSEKLTKVHIGQIINDKTTV